jgi:Fe2+ transport system protein FeoA
MADLGREVQILAIRGCGRQRQRLRELGILEGQTVRVITNHDPLICQVGQSRFGLCHRLARKVIVAPVAAMSLARSA